MKALLKRTLERAIWIGTVTALVGVLLVWWGSSLHGTYQTLLTNLGTAVVTIGLVGVLYDLLLRRLLVSEVLEAVGVHQSASAFGLRQICETANLDLAALVTDANEVTVLPLDPVRWADHEFELVRRAARDRALAVTVFLPANDSPYVEVLAERLGKTVGQIGEALDEFASGQLGNAWAAEPVAAGGELIVYRYAGMPATGLLMTDRVVALEVGPLIRYRPLDRQGYMVVASRQKAPITDWVERQIHRERTDENLSKIDQQPQPERDLGDGKTDLPSEVHEEPPGPDDTPSADDEARIGRRTSVGPPSDDIERTES